MATCHHQLETAPMTLFASQIENLAETKGSLQRLTSILDRDNQLLKRKDFRGYVNVWEWMLHQKWADIVAMHLLLGRRALVPINMIDTITGDSILTNIKSQELELKVLKTLLQSGEHLDYVNKKTGDTFLHAMAKYHRNTDDKPYLSAFTEEMQELIVEGNINFPNPDSKNKKGMTALQLTLEIGNFSLGNALVELLGASWKRLPIRRFSSNKTIVNLLNKWKETYELHSNNFLSEVGDVCLVCYELLNVPQEVYSMECCGALIHVECFRTYLSRSTKPQCMFCNMLVVEEVRYSVPPTIYKKKWQQHITKETIAAAAVARARTIQKKFEVELVKKIKEKEEAARKNEEESPIVPQEDYPPEEVVAGASTQPAHTFRPLAASRRKRSSARDDERLNHRRQQLQLDDDNDDTFRVPARIRRRRCAVRDVV